MKESLDNGEIYRIVVIVLFVGALVLFAIFSGGKPAGPPAGGTAHTHVAFVTQVGITPQTMPPRNCLMYPYAAGCPRAMGMQTQPGALQPGPSVPQGGYGPQTVPPRNCLMYPYSPGCPRAMAMPTPSVPMQTAAFGSNTLTLPMGVALEGRGTVVSVEPGSPAQRAGIQVGDLINRINGK